MENFKRELEKFQETIKKIDVGISFDNNNKKIGNVYYAERGQSKNNLFSYRKSNNRISK